jgi:ElaB/YqjD/DUF883 family membrane-anchored ribosome-binding protein
MTTRTAQISSRIDSLKDSVKDLIDVGTDTAASVKDATVSTASKLASRTAKLVKKHPIAAVAIAFGVGYVAMRLVRR